MSTQIQPPPWHDPIVAELHDIREKLVEKYHGDMAAYSQDARAHALALGFKIEPCVRQAKQRARKQAFSSN